MKSADKIAIRQTPDGAAIRIKAVPGSSRDKITTSAAAEKGRANQALINTFAKALKIPARDVSVIAGLTNPHKEFLVKNISADGLRKLIAKI